MVWRCGHYIYREMAHGGGLSVCGYGWGLGTVNVNVNVLVNEARMHGAGWGQPRSVLSHSLPTPSFVYV
jgi:hypothetical protein